MDTPRMKTADPELEKLKITHAIEVEDNEREYKHKTQWESCCVRADKRAITYFSQVVFSAIIIAFCISMLVSNQDCATFSRYRPLLTFVIGYLMPSPQLKSE